MPEHNFSGILWLIVTSIVGLLMWSAKTDPEEAVSNLSKWVIKFGLYPTPPWLEATNRVILKWGKWVLGILLMIGAYGLFTWFSQSSHREEVELELPSFADELNFSVFQNRMQKFMNPDAGLNIKNITILAPNSGSAIHLGGVPVHISGTAIIIGGQYGIDASKDSPVTVEGGSTVTGKKAGIHATDHSPVTIK